MQTVSAAMVAGDVATQNELDAGVAAAIASAASAAAAAASAAIAALPGMKNLLINGSFMVNQRAFAGGALAAGVYGFDRWKAGTGGCTVSVSAGVTSLTGPLIQVIEAPALAAVQVTISVNNPSGAIPVTIGDGGANTASGSIPAGSGRQSVTLTVPAAVTGDVTLQLNPASATTFSEVQVEIGAVATSFERRHIAFSTMLCCRYYWGGTLGSTQNQGSGTGVVNFGFPVIMRAVPTFTKTGAGTVNPTVFGVLISSASNTTTTATAWTAEL